jgi:hypothetical protein
MGFADGIGTPGKATLDLGPSRPRRVAPGTLGGRTLAHRHPRPRPRDPGGACERLDAGGDAGTDASEADPRA